MFKKCKKCGQIVWVIKGDNELICCGEEMQEVVANSVDASFEKHIPQKTVEKDKIIVEVNHVMENDHYIEWLAIANDRKFYLKRLLPGEEAKSEFCYIDNAVAYSYCNKHGLWKN